MLYPKVVNIKFILAGLIFKRLVFRYNYYINNPTLISNFTRLASVVAEGRGR